MRKEIREMVRRIESAGYTVEHGRKHLKVRGADGKTVAHLPTTPGRGRWKQNLRAELRRKGIL